MKVKPGLYRNKKTERIYTVIRTILNSTNAQNGQIMILYHYEEEYYAREIEEFLQKFDPVLSI